MLKKALPLLLLFISLFLLISCNDGFPFISEMWVKGHSGGGGKGETHEIIVKAEPAAKQYNALFPLPDPAFTYTYSPDPLPHGVSLTGELARDPGEDVGTYVIRQGTVQLTGVNASKYKIKYISGVFSISY